MRLRCALLLWIVFLAQPTQAAEGTRLVLGVLEEPQCKPDAGLVVRPLFAKSDGLWIALDKHASAKEFQFDGVSWAVGLDGRLLGRITTNDPGFTSPYAWTYSRDFYLRIQQEENIPKIVNRSNDFAGWCDPPKHRPLVVASAGHILDPEGWHRVRDALPGKKNIFDVLKDILAGKQWCRTDNGGKQQKQTIAPSSLAIRAVYADNTGRQLVQVRIAPRLHECDSELGEGGATHWVMIGRESMYIGSLGSLVDAADYDGDGSADFVFWSSGYNEDGYVLYTNGFKDKVAFVWNYH